MVLGRPKYRKLTVLPQSYPSKIGAPRGMTREQYIELDREFEQIDGSGEPLGIGLLRLYFIPLFWREKSWANGFLLGSHAFTIPTLLHDFQLTSDEFFVEGCERLARFNQNKALQRLSAVFRFILLFHKEKNK